MSGGSDTESLEQMLLEEWQCNICMWVPTRDIVNFLLLQTLENGPYLLTLPNGSYYVRCYFPDCQRYFHLQCIHVTFPDESLNQSHFNDLKENGIHCPCCEPGHEKH